MFVNVVLQIGITALLARLLTPSDFGLVAMAGLFLRFGQYFAQMGAGQAVVQKSELSSGDMHTAFTSALLIGAAFCGMFVVLAPLAGALFPNTPGVVTVARVMSLTFVIGGLTASTQGLLQRRFAFRAIALTEIGSFVLGYAFVGLALAFSGFGAWSLVAASLGQGVLAAAAYIFFCRRDIGLGLNARSFRAIYAFGWRVSLIGFGEFIASNLDTLWTGHFLGSRATGLYTRATNLATVPLNLLNVSLSRVLLPGFSRIQFERTRLKSVYLATITVSGAIVMPLAWGLAGASHEVVATLLGNQWLAAVPVLAILSLAAPFSLLAHFGAIICEATASLNVKIAITLAGIGWLAALLAGLARYGIVGIATAFAISVVATYVSYLVVMKRQLRLSLQDAWRCHSIALIAGAITGLLLFGVHAGLAKLSWPPPAVLAVQLSLGTVCLLVTVTRARGGWVWREVRGRLVDAGYGPDAGNAASWVIRLIDALG